MNSNPTHRLASLTLALTGGAALTLSFPGIGIWPLAYLGMALLFASLWRDSLPWAYLTGFLYHLTFFLPLLWWAYYSIGFLPWFALSVAESLIMALAGPLWVGVRRVARLGTHPILGAVAFSLIYVGCEQLRAMWPFGGFPWGRLSFSQADSFLASLAYLGGQPLVSLAVALTGSLLAAAWFMWRRRIGFAKKGEADDGGGAAGVAAEREMPAGERAASRRSLALVALAAAAALAIGPLALRLPTNAQAGTLATGAVQGNIADSSHGAETRMRGVTANHVAGTRKLAAEVGQGKLDVVLWPENAADISPRADAQVAAEINSAAEAAGAPILVGSIEYLPDKTRKNVSLLWWPGRGVIDEYAKQHPAPFAEYIPLRSVVARFSDKVKLVTSEMVPGHTPATITLPVPRLDRDVTLADVICFEVAYDDIVRQGVSLGGQLIVVQTNNASFGFTPEGAQQLAMTRMRAIEHGRAAVQISTVGLSALIAPNGRILQSGGLFTAEQFHADLPLRTELSPAVRWAGPLGTATILVAAVAALLAAVGAVRGRKRIQ